MLRQYIGDKAFYQRVFSLTIPIMIQNFITNFVNMLDNIMVGQIGTAEMTGVSVINQLILVFNLCIFGIVSGAGVFGAQFFGKRDMDGLRNTHRFKLVAGLILGIVGIAVLWLGRVPLINAFLEGEGDPADAQAAFSFSEQYLSVMVVGLIPYAIVQCYASTLRETGQTAVPMAAGIGAVLINLVGNYILIFGHLGAPRLGVIGAAIATVISRFAEWIIVATWTRRHKHRCEFIVGLYRNFRIPKKLIINIFRKGTPLILNETMWGAGSTMLNRCYSKRALTVLPAVNICSTFFNVFAVSFISVGNAIGIILGQMLGANQLEEAHRESKKLIATSVMVSTAFAVIFAVCIPFIPQLYNTTQEVRQLSQYLMMISAAILPFDAIAHASYFTLRSGGKMLITILFDSVSMWVTQVLPAFLLVQFTDLPIVAVVGICNSLCLVKAAAGIYLVRKGSWVQNMVANTTS